MSDVSKTNELIEDADRHLEQVRPYVGEDGGTYRLIKRLRDALEAKTCVRVDMSPAEGVETQLAVQGEPNDDREALRKLAEGGKAAKEKLYEIGTGVGGLAVNFPDLYEAYGQWDDLSAHAHADTVLMLLDELDAASRATVPDAATGRFECDRECIGEGAPIEDCSAHGRTPRDLWGQIDEARKAAYTALTERDAATELLDSHRCNESAERAYERTIRAEAERDAALAAIERARAIHNPIEIEPSSTICGECSFRLPNGKYFGKIVEFPCDTRAALDGVPEPDVEWGCRSSSHTPLNANVRTFYFLEDAQSHARDCQSPAIVRRRKAGQWFPVEGESDAN